MNGTEQRHRRTAVDTLDAQLANMATLVEELDERLVLLATVVQRIDERQVAFSQGTAAAYDALSERVYANRAMPFGARLRWLLWGA